MKKIINGFLIGIGATIGVMLVLATLVAYSKKEEVVGIERSVANNMLNAGEDCAFSPDGKTFYINKDYDYDGNVDAIVGYTVID